MKRLSRTSRLWAVFFGAWLLLLTGIFHPLLQAPGVRQSLRLRNMATNISDEITQWEQRLAGLELRTERMKTHAPTQERAVREGLGFTRPDEWVFEISFQKAQARSQ